MSPSVQTLIDLLPEPVLLVSRGAVVLHVNRAMERELGARRSELAGASLPDLLVTPPDEMAAYLRRCAGSLQPMVGALVFRTPGNGTLRMRCQGAATLTDEGGPGPIMLRCSPHRQAVSEFVVLSQKVQALTREVLLRRRIEDRLRASEERLRLAVEAADMGTWDIDLVTGTWECSERCKVLFGLPAHGPINRDLVLERLHPEDRERTVHAVDLALDPTGPGTFEAEFRTVGLHDGAERWIASKGRVIFAHGRALRFTGAALDITERRRAADHQRLLINELNHRVKNTLATVQSIATQTVRHSPSLEAFRQAFGTRLMALSQTQNLLTDAKWRGTELRTLLETELTPYRSGDETRVALRGEPVQLPPKAAVAFGLTVHELATNAAKYGALSVPDGRVEVDWRVERQSGEPWLHLRWAERDGPAVVPPQRRGFGSRLIERGLAYELGGQVRLEFASEGVRCVVTVPHRTPKQDEHV